MSGAHIAAGTAVLGIGAYGCTGIGAVDFAGTAAFADSVLSGNIEWEADKRHCGIKLRSNWKTNRRIWN